MPAPVATIPVIPIAAIPVAAAPVPATPCAHAGAPVESVASAESMTAAVEPMTATTIESVASAGQSVASAAMTATTVESVTSTGESVASAGESVASAAMTTTVTSTVTVTSTRKGQRCHREHAHHCQNCQFRFYNFNPCYLKTHIAQNRLLISYKTPPPVLSFAHPRFEYWLRIGRIAACQQSRLELGLRFRRGSKKGEQSSLLTHIATESVSLLERTKS